MLGGFEVLTKQDVKGSNSFLKKLWKVRPELGRACAVDCGAGIGRVTKNLLLPLFQEVHLLEQSAPLITNAPKFLGKAGAARTTLLCQGMQSFEPSPATYDVVWVQWVIGHLTDADLVTFLWRCKAALKPGGVICIKDNTYATSVEEDGSVECFSVDREDSSLTRSTEYFEAVFAFAGLNVLQKETQGSFPEELYPVLMYALC
jgi:protein N-terminal methyltransferase